MAWNTATNREAMRSLSYVRYSNAMRAAQRGVQQTQALETYLAECDEISNLSMPELVILTWEESCTLFEGHMHPNSGIYMEPHLHRYEVCYCLDECSWPYRKEPCQAYEHWDKRCDKHWTIWWNKYGKAENEEYLRNNPPKWIHDHERPRPLDYTHMKCETMSCRNFGKAYNGHELWNGATS